MLASRSNSLGKVIHRLTARDMVRAVITRAVVTQFEHSRHLIHRIGRKEIHRALHHTVNLGVVQALRQHLQRIARRVSLTAPAHHNLTIQRRLIHIETLCATAKVNPAILRKAVLLLNDSAKLGE